MRAEVAYIVRLLRNMAQYSYVYYLSTTDVCAHLLLLVYSDGGLFYIHCCKCLL